MIFLFKYSFYKYLIKINIKRFWSICSILCAELKFSFDLRDGIGFSKYE